MPSVVGHLVRASGQFLEVPGGELALVECGKHDPVHEFGPKFLHHIQGKGWLAGSYAVQEADVGVESYLLERAMYGNSQQPVSERKGGVERIGWRGLERALGAAIPACADSKCRQAATYRRAACPSIPMTALMLAAY
jgi:hypothetical protein